MLFLMNIMKKYRIRKYGFHGTSHKYVSQKAAEMLGKDIKDLKLVTCHLGNGASCAAVDGGVCIDTSMGFTPLDGLVMGTRSGTIDPAVITTLMQKEKISAEDVVSVLNKKSGILGVSGISSDFRDVEAAAAEGNERAQMAVDIFAQRVKTFIGAYVAELNGADAIIFTAGVGENDIGMRELICKGLDGIGIKIDPVRNKVRGEERILSTDDSRIKVLLVPTNEELMIAEDTVEIVSKL